MKKSLVALAVLAGFAGAAAAQSSVTLFGVVDLAARYTKANGNNKSELAKDGNSSSRIGVRGIEDLGGGLKAGFWLESALSADTGTADTAFWSRRASVSLFGEFGEVRLGRGKTSTRLVIDDFDVYSTTGLGDISKVYGRNGTSPLGSGAPNLNRSDNMVQYFLPSDLGGVYGSFDVAAGEGAASGKFFGGRLGYKEGALHVAGGYQTTDVANNGKYKLGSIGVSYDFGVAKANLLLSQGKFGSLKQNVYTIGTIVPVTAAGSFTAQFTKSSTNGAADALATAAGDAKLYTVGYQHNLSKRTALYSTVSLVDNAGRSAYYLTSTGAAVVAGGRQGGVDVGIRHSF